MNPSPQAAARPIAERMRPRTLDEVAGQPHLLAQDAPLRVALESGHIPSMVFWGPPGVGKTTLALLAFLSLSLRERAGVRESARSTKTQQRGNSGNPR